MSASRQPLPSDGGAEEERICNVISSLAKDAKAWVALGGCGYKVCNVAGAWTLAWAIVKGLRPGEDLPESMMESMRADGCHKRKLRDPEHKSVRQVQWAGYMAE